jgi:penicillin-binding protein 2
MFHRRLLLLAGVVLVGVVVLLGQLGRLTVARGAELREEAESRLVIWDWLPTSRGKIIDRKNRVLAQDRPSFEVCVDFRVITGDWAVAQAARAAKRAQGSSWFKLDTAQRQALVDEYIPVFQAHVDRMWEQVATLSGTDPNLIRDRRQEIIERVDQRLSSIVTRRLTRELESKLAVGEEITTETEEELKRQVDAPIADQRSPHTVLTRIPDSIAFEFMRLEKQSVDLAVPTADGGSEARSVPLLPGLTVQHSGDREYPFDTIRVGIDLSTLPGPMAQPGAVLEVDAEGVAYNVLGRVSEGFNGDRQQTDGTISAGHRERRRERLRIDPVFSDRVLTPAGIDALPRRLDRGEYRDEDLAGQGGVEEAQEPELRGLRGLAISELESGRKLTPVDAQVGRDVHLTLDIMLQARVQAAMSPELGLAVAQLWHGHQNPTVPVGTPLNGAAVVLDVDSGDILAMVSTPSMPREVLRETPSTIYSDALNKAVNMPWIDRSISRPYPPGSIAKALVLLGAVGQGKLNLDTPIDCTGHLFPGKPDQFRCWAFKQYQRNHTDWLGHAPSAPEALMVSCNIYFFTLGQRLGGDGIARTYRMFGLGETLDIGLGESAVTRGYLGTRKVGAIDLPASASNPGTIGLHDAIQMGIGQGPVAWTPLHAADGYATIGRGGVRIPPHVVAPDGTPDAQDLRLNPRALREALEGLSLSVNHQDGTGHHVTFNAETEQAVRVPFFRDASVQVWGKTGTAEAPKIPVRPSDPLYEQGHPDPDLPEGVRALRAGDHSWFVVLVGAAGENRPRYAIAVMMEYAGSGGKVSGPIVNQIIYALKAEGYL